MEIRTSAARGSLTFGGKSKKNNTNRARELRNQARARREGNSPPAPPLTLREHLSLILGRGLWRQMAWPWKSYYGD